MYDLKDMTRDAASTTLDIATGRPTTENRHEPYGLAITLTHEELVKMDLATDPDVGDMLHFAAMARVTHTSHNEDGSCRIEMQITHLCCIEDEDREGLGEDEESESDGDGY